MASTDRRKYFDYIVIGCGGIGSAAVYRLSKRSKSVLGLEQFGLGHENGGSQDHSRIIRLPYREEYYAKLTRETFKAWEELEADAGLQVLWKNGLLQLFRRGLTDYIRDEFIVTNDKYNITYERLNNEEAMARHPQFTLGADISALYTKDGGLVDAARGNALHIQLARGNGATIIDNCPATRIGRASNGNVVVYTTKGVFECRKVVVTAGAWLNSVLGSIGVHIPVTVTQEQVTYYATPHTKMCTKEKLPIWIYYSPKYNYYTIPIHGNTGTKIGMDTGGNIVTADTRTFRPDPVRERKSIKLVNELCPKFGGPVLKTKTCLYTMPPDRHFVVDTCEYKGWSDVVVCVGAGHAYMWAAFLGKVLSELAVDRRTQYDISHFKITRAAIQDPNFKRNVFRGRDNAYEAKL